MKTRASRMVRARLLFGLGNPGPRYERTRHNVGWLVLDALASRHGAELRPTRLLDGSVGDATIAGVRVRLVQPGSWMNLVGPVYLRALDVYEADPADALVIVDDFMLPFGRLRFRASGSSGGHNGLRSIADTLGAEDYPRLKIGIGPVPEPMDPADYVLQRWGAEQKDALPEVVARAADAAEAWVADGIETAMNRFNA
jgi:PTH1 family peptidyl-tRNA hydrolase